MWSGSLDPGHALKLAEQLKLMPDSRVRSLWQGNIEFLGWGPLQYALANLYDLLHSIVLGMGGKKLKDKDRYPRPKPPVQQPKTIAEFNIEAFMRTLAN